MRATVCFDCCGERAAAAASQAAAARTLRLVIMNEILGHIRPPGIEGIVRRMIPRGPVACCRDVVDVSGIFAEASPWILHIVKVVRTEHMASQAPAFGEALVEHVHGS